MMRTSLRLRLALWFTAALFVTMGSSFLAVYFFVRNAWESSIDRQLNQDFETVGSFLFYRPKSIGAQGHLYSDIMFLVKDGGRILYHSSAMCNSSYFTESGERETIPTEGLWRSSSGKVFALRSAPMMVSFRDCVATIAIDLGPMNQSLSSLANILLLALGAAMAGSVLGGFGLATRSLSPLGRMAEKMRSITTEGLSERLVVENPSDEMGRVAIVFNQTMDRLEASFTRLKSFAAEVSHELRTPLTAIRSVGELALRASMGGGGAIPECVSSSAEPASTREAIGSMLEEADRLSFLVDAMLTLARSDTGQSPPEPAEADLGALVLSVVETLQVLAEEKGQRIEMTPPEPAIIGSLDETTARRALVNVVDNAIRYTPAGGSIRVILRRPFPDKAFIDIVDGAEAIPESEREALFERFHRSPRNRSSQGLGLGLAIARWAIELNGGKIAFVDHEGSGNCCRIELAAR